MIEIKHLVRQAVLDKLANVTYLGVNIPGDDENLTKPPAQLPIGNSTGVQAYFLIQNQTLQDDSPKCGVNQNTQLQIDVTTIFPAGTGANTGNYAHADLISNVILGILFPYPTNQTDLFLVEAQLWMGSLVSSRHIFERYASSRAYRNILILNFGVKQNPLTT